MGGSEWSGVKFLFALLSHLKFIQNFEKKISNNKITITEDGISHAETCL